MARAKKPRAKTSRTSQAFPHPIMAAQAKKRASASSASSASLPYTIATIGSHSALQILRGAKEEGFRTIVVCEKGREKPYRMFPVADEMHIVNSFSSFLRVEPALKRKRAILIPHASFIEHLGIASIERISLPYFGNKDILRHESNRNLQRKWLSAAGLKQPRIFTDPKKIDCSVIVKFHGAKGGRGYFVANSEKDFRRKIVDHAGKEYVIQEYIVGVPVYIHYFYSPLTKSLEIMGFDKRYESNVDSLGRISARDQIALETVDPSYVIVGNVPIVIRESLLPNAIEMGEAVVHASKKKLGSGLFGPFCIETILTPELDFYAFEISARIVAGTNPYVHGSPYTYLKYDEPMSTGRRIAREIKNAIAQGRLKEVLS